MVARPRLIVTSQYIAACIVITETVYCAVRTEYCHVTPCEGLWSRNVRSCRNFIDL